MELKESSSDKKNDNSSFYDESQRHDDCSTSNAPVTSRNFESDTANPEHDSHNMNDLKGLDYNSADEIRQAMKSFMTGKTPQIYFGEEDCTSRNSIQTSPFDAKTLKHEHTPKVIPSNVAPEANRKRRGRPAKAGPSKKIRRANVTDMYLGKLSNVVRFKTRRVNYESDIDSLYYYY